MRYFALNGGSYAACDFEPQNAVEEIDEETYNEAVAAIIVAAQEPEADEATEADLMDALAELGVIE